MLEKNAVFEMTCTALGQDAHGVCRHEGIVVFVPELLPGEQALVRITKPERSYAYGRVEKRLSDSPQRQTPFCPIAKRCGGCSCQHMSYAASLEYKRSQVQDLLQRVGHVDLSVPPVLGMTEPFRYRNKGMYPIGIVDGKPAFGFYAKRSHDLIPLPPDGCLIQDEASSRILHVLLHWVETSHVPVYQEKTHSGLLRHVMIRHTQSGAVMVVLVATRATLPDRDLLCSRLREAVPQIESIAVSVNSRPGNTILGQDIHLLFGNAALQDTLMGLQFSVSPLSFFQVNPVQTQTLYGLALDFAGLTGTETVIDAYCGTGTISLLLAKKARHVTGIEIVEAAIIDARQNALKNNIRNVDFIPGATEQILPQLVRDGLRPDVIVLDPPRKGCDPAVLEAIAAADPERIVYVSCAASTLARDISLLKDLGYLPAKLQCVDMFCWTSAVEVVTLLQLSNRKPDAKIRIDIDLEDYYQIKDKKQSKES